jgi:hypothetical protein
MTQNLSDRSRGYARERLMVTPNSHCVKIVSKNMACDGVICLNSQNYQKESL